MPDLTQSKVALFDAARKLNYGDDVTLQFLRYKGSQSFEPLKDSNNLEIPAFTENFHYYTSATRATGLITADVEIVQFADIDGIYYAILSKATACKIDETVYRLERKTKPRRYVDDDTDFTRLWEWYLVELNKTA